MLPCGLGLTQALLESSSFLDAFGGSGGPQIRLDFCFGVVASPGIFIWCIQCQMYQHEASKFKMQPLSAVQNNWLIHLGRGKSWAYTKEHVPWKMRHNVLLPGVGCISKRDFYRNSSFQF